MTRYKAWFTVFLLLFLATLPALAQSPPEPVTDTWQVFIVNLVLLTVSMTIPTLTVMTIQWLHKQAELIKARLSSQQLDFLQAVTAMVVKAAEQSALIGEIQKAGSIKKAFAIDAIQNALRQHGMNSLADNVDEISNAIEAAIMEGIQMGDPQTVLLAQEGKIPNNFETARTNISPV